MSKELMEYPVVEQPEFYDPTPNWSSLVNKEAEEWLLGEALTRPEMVLASDLEIDDFYVHRHRWIWEAMKILALLGDLDIETLTRELLRVGKLDQAGGKDFMKWLDQHRTDELRAQSTRMIVKEYAARRRLKIFAESVARKSFDFTTDMNDLGDLYAELINVNKSPIKSVSLMQGMGELFEEILERHQNPNSIWGLATGFNKFDYITGGLQAGESMIISGNPGIGKSMFAMQMGVQLSHSAYGVIYSLEMTQKAVLRRILSAKTRVRSREIKSGVFDDDRQADLERGADEITKLNLAINDDPNLTTTTLQADLMRLKNEKDIKWFIVDYMSLLGDRTSDKEHERIGAISRAVKLICRRLELAGILIHSMTKTGMDSPIPSLTALRGEAGVSFDSDLILFLTAFNTMTPEDNSITENDRENMRTLIFGKGRELENPSKYIQYVKSPDYPEFREYAPEPTTPIVETDGVTQYEDWSK